MCVVFLKPYWRKEEIQPRFLLSPIAVMSAKLRISYNRTRSILPDMESLTETFLHANVLNENGNRKAAFDAFTQFIEQTNVFSRNDSQLDNKIKEMIALAYNNRGFLHYLNVDFDDAIQDYTESIKYNQQLPVSWYNRGLIHYRLGRFNEAVEDMKSALLIDPDFESAKQCLIQATSDKIDKDEKIRNNPSVVQGR